MFYRSTVIFGILLLAASAAAPASGGPYYLTDLGTIGGTSSYAMAVNDSGEVAGATTTSTALTTTAAVYTGGAWDNIGALVGTKVGYANGITDSGLVSCGRTLTISYIYNLNTGQVINMQTQPGVCNGVSNHCGCDSYFGGEYPSPTPINSSGQIVGYYVTSVDDYNLLVYSGGTNGSTSVVTTPATDTTQLTDASGISDSGVVVGNYAFGPNPARIGFYYQNGTEYDIANMNYPEAINGNTVVGANDAGSAVDAAIYTLGASSATDIGGLPGAVQTIAYGVNSAGTVVGFSDSDAFVYSNGTMTDLNSLIIGPNPFSELQVAYGISSNGEYIVGDGTTSTGNTHGFLLTAAIPGDAIGDGTVDINDLTIVLTHYGQTGQTWSDGEFTGSGTVDINDLTIVLAHYGDSVGAGAGSLSAVPEPGGLVLLAASGFFGLLACARRKRWKDEG
jgi:probable HAF family extracellular repeat protein